MRLEDFIDKKRKSKIALITACGAKKKSSPMEAYRLYFSSRIKAVYNRRSFCDMYILSAQYGLVEAHQVIKPYNRVMDEKRALELVPSVVEIIQNYGIVIFFKGGARKAYLSCVKEASKSASIILITFGYANMGGINDLSKIIASVDQGNLEKIREIKHANVYFF